MTRDEALDGFRILITTKIPDDKLRRELYESAVNLAHASAIEVLEKCKAEIISTLEYLE